MPCSCLILEGNARRIQVAILAQVAAAVSSSSQESAVEAHVQELEVALEEAHQGETNANAQALRVEQDWDAASEALAMEKKAREEAERQASSVSS